MLTLIFRYYCLTLNSRLKKIWHHFRLQSSRMLAQCGGRRVDVPRDSKQILQFCCFSFNKARPRASSLTLDLLPSTTELASMLSLTLLLLPLLHLLRHWITPIPSTPQICSTLYAASPIITLLFFFQNLTCLIFYTFFMFFFIMVKRPRLHGLNRMRTAERNIWAERKEFSSFLSSTGTSRLASMLRINPVIPR